MEKYIKQIEAHLKVCGVDAAKAGYKNCYGYGVFTVADCNKNKNIKNKKQK